jgi:cytochrome c oxidase subunit I
MPRRIPDYPDTFTFWNVVVTIGSFISLIGVIVFLYMFFKAFLDHKNNKEVN